MCVHTVCQILLKVPKIKCNRARVTIFAQHCCMNIRSEEEVGQMHITDIRSKEDETTYPLVCLLFNRYAFAIHAIITMLSKVFSFTLVCFFQMW